MIVMIEVGLQSIIAIPQVTLGVWRNNGNGSTGFIVEPLRNFTKFYYGAMQ